MELSLNSSLLVIAGDKIGVLTVHRDHDVLDRSDSCSNLSIPLFTFKLIKQDIFICCNESFE